MPTAQNRRRSLRVADGISTHRAISVGGSGDTLVRRRRAHAQVALIAVRETLARRTAPAHAAPTAVPVLEVRVRLGVDVQTTNIAIVGAERPVLAHGARAISADGRSESVV